MNNYQPPYKIASSILALVANISEQIGRWGRSSGDGEEGGLAGVFEQ